MQAHYVSKVVL